MFAAANGKHAEWNGGAHARAPRNDGGGQPDAGGDVVSGGRQRQAGAEVLENKAASQQFEGDNHGGTADKNFSGGVELQRRNGKSALVFAHHAAGGQRADAQPSHEAGEHDGDHGRGDSKLRHRKAKPDQFVENAAESGDQEEAEKPAAAAGGAVACSRPEFCVALGGRNFHGRHGL